MFFVVYFGKGVQEEKIKTIIKKKKKKENKQQKENQAACFSCFVLITSTHQ